MGYKNMTDPAIKTPYEDVRKGKSGSSGHQQPQQQSNKNDKYGTWGSVYKNKQNFIDMHIC